MTKPVAVFISYASEDFARVESLYEKLADMEQVKPWMDKKDLLAGQKWEPSIWKAIRRADFFIICLSNRATTKRGFLQREINEALKIWEEKLEDDIYLVPVRLEPCNVPARLAEFQWVDLFE